MSSGASPFGGKAYGGHSILAPAGALGILVEQISYSGVGNDHSYSITTKWGPTSTWTTTNVAGTAAGFRTTLLSNRTRETLLQSSFALSSTADILFFIGYKTDDTQFPVGTDPLNGESGVGLCLSDGNFRVCYNDGSDTTFISDFPEPIPADTNDHTVLIQTFDSTQSASCVIQLDGLNPLDNPSPSPPLVLTTEIPFSNVNLAGIACVEPTTTTVKSMNIYRWEGLF